MSFDFLAAINGSPIYLRGEEITPNYIPAIKSWEYMNVRYSQYGICYIPNNINLSTEPPINTTIKTVYVYKSVTGRLHIFTSLLSPLSSMCFKYIGKYNVNEL